MALPRETGLSGLYRIFAGNDPENRRGVTAFPVFIFVIQWHSTCLVAIVLSFGYTITTNF